MVESRAKAFGSSMNRLAPTNPQKTSKEKPDKKEDQVNDLNYAVKLYVKVRSKLSMLGQNHQWTWVSERMYSWYASLLKWPSRRFHEPGVRLPPPLLRLWCIDYGAGRERKGWPRRISRNDFMLRRVKNFFNANINAGESKPSCMGLVGV